MTVNVSIFVQNLGVTPINILLQWYKTSLFHEFNLASFKAYFTFEKKIQMGLESTWAKSKSGQPETKKSKLLEHA